MSKVLIHSWLILLNLLFSLNLLAQKDILNGLFDKEEPVFNATVLPTAEEGTVKVVFYFTHSKYSHLEASFWMEDNGTNLQSSGNKKLLQGLKPIGNRRQDTIRVTGLTSGHFYTFGLDYKKPSTFSGKFISKTLEDGYRYNYVEPTKPNKPLALIDENSDAPAPCIAPELYVQVENAGYCGPDNRPAIIVECQNCHKKDWEFSVETRTEFSQWESIRSDGRRQTAYNNATRTEPLCTLEPGSYQVRVLAWGDNCRTPVINTVPFPIVIRDIDYKAAATTKQTQEQEITIETLTVAIPDTCPVLGWGMMYGDYIQGTVELAANSSCSSLSPFAKLTYIHPGYRDLELPPITLEEGKKIPFEIQLDEKDRQRGIHPIRVVTYVRPNLNTEPVPVSSFWIRAKGDGTKVESYQFDAEPEPQQPLTERIETATKPDVLAENNCSKIADLQLIYAPNNPTQPRYISWETPDCCIDENCSYFVWVGSNPVDIRLLVQGKKTGEFVREELFGLNPEDRFFEVVVSSTKGTRNASYVVGEGAQYEDLAVVEYEQQVSISPSAGKDIISSRGGLNSRITTTPSRPISDFNACKIYREIAIVGDQPIHPGDDITIKYDHRGSGYSYTLYHQPQNSSQWLIAPGTREMQSSPEFVLKTAPEHNGKYIILVYKLSKEWGCLSATPEDPVVLKVAN